MTPNIADMIRHHVSLEVRCLDRLSLQAYLPKLQTSGGLCYFLHDHLGFPIPSPALFKPLHDRFVTAVDRFVAAQGLPVVRFEPRQRKDDVVAAYRTRFTAREGVVVVGVAQEKMRPFKAHKRPGPAVSFDFSRHSVAVNHDDFYVQDREWGPAFLKIDTCLPYPVKICLNGHEWSSNSSVGRVYPSRVSTTASWPVRRPSACRPSVTGSPRLTSRRSSIAGRSASPGR